MSVVDTPAPTRRHSVIHRLKVAAVERLTADAVVVTFDVPAELAADYEYAPGQHVNVALPGDLQNRRSYSICSPAGSGTLQIAIKRIPDGVFSKYALEEMAPGAELDVMTPAGRFTPRLDPAPGRRYGAIAAGSGITPIISIISSVLRADPQSRFVLIYGNRSVWTTMFLDELADLKDSYPERLQLIHVLSRETQGAELLSGRIDSNRLGRILDDLVPDRVDEWFLCGPYELVTDASEVLTQRGADRASVHTELFHAGELPPRVERPASVPVTLATKVTAVLDGRETTLTLDDPDETVLEAVLRVRNDAPFACKGGVCGTCRAKVLHGSVQMERNYALEDDEVAAGYVLTCQSHPMTPELSVDYDA